MDARRNSPAVATADREIVSTRVVAAPRDLVFKAFSDPEHLVQWWGPNGFTNTFHEFDMRPGGAWRFVMHGPDGADYPNESIFLEIVKPERIVFDHISGHHFQMRITLAEQDGETRLTWRMLFDSVAERDKVKALVTDANEQNFDRLEAQLASIAMPPRTQPVQAPQRDHTESTIAGERNMDNRIDEAVNAAAREIVISRVFDAPRELVWQAWTDPRHVVQWWGPNGFTTTIEKMDVRPGGVWKHVMHGPDGTDYPNSSVFKEVVKPARIVFSHGGGKEGGPGVHFTATWTFETLAANQTRVTIHMVFDSAADRDTVVKEYGAIEGGKQTLGRLAEYLAQMG